MTRRVISILIALNVAGVFAFAAMWFYAAWLAPMASNMRVTELDRAQIIDTAKLTAFDPALAANVRYNLPAWIAERERSASVFSAVSGLVVCAVNLAALVIGRIYAERKQPRGEQDQSAPTVRPVG